jgi:hypothetical protein
MAQFHPKVTAGLVAGAITGIVVAEAARRGMPIDAAEGSNITALISFFASWYMPSEDAAPIIPPPANPAA